MEEGRGKERGITLRGEEGMEGVDIKKGMERFGNNRHIYTEVLRSYAANTRGLMNRLNEYLAAEKMREYSVDIHGIKGSSYGVCANEIGRLAEELEGMSKAGNIEGVKSKHRSFGEKLEILLCGIEKTLGMAESGEKPEAESPDPALLEELREACRGYEIGEAKRIMKQLESFRYKSGEKMIAWLRGQVSEVNFEEICGGSWVE